MNRLNLTAPKHYEPPRLSLEDYAKARAVFFFLGYRARRAVCDRAHVHPVAAIAAKAWLENWPAIKGGIFLEGYDLKHVERLAMGAPA